MMKNFFLFFVLVLAIISSFQIDGVRADDDDDAAYLKIHRLRKTHQSYMG